jgi:hypothetical protein
MKRFKHTNEEIQNAIKKAKEKEAKSNLENNS